MADNQDIESMPNILAIALKKSGGIVMFGQNIAPGINPMPVVSCCRQHPAIQVRQVFPVQSPLFVIQKGSR
jgi:hypothetical protein